MTRLAFHRRAVALFAVVALGAGLSGCAGLGKALGVGKNPPDEFAIVTRAPLVVPPDFSLRPPRPGEARPQELSTAAQARLALFGGETATVAEGQPSLGEQVLMQNAGVLNSNPNIRSVIDAEAGGIASKDEGLANMILFWRTNGMEIDDSEAPLRVDNPEEWLAERRDAIETVVGEDANVRISKSRVLNLPGVR